MPKEGNSSEHEEEPPKLRTLAGWLRKRGWQGAQGPRQVAVKRALEEFVEADIREFTLQEVMERAGLDYDDFSDRTATSHFLRRMREVLLDFADWFWGQPQYKKYIDDGLSDKAVFKL